MRLTLIIHDFGCGGAQRVMATLVNAWVARGYDITVITIADCPMFYRLPEQVTVHTLNLANEPSTIVDALWANVRRIRKLRRQVSAARPDVLISFMDCSNVLSVLATVGTGVPTVLCEHTDPSQHPVKPIWSFLRMVTYPVARAVTFLTANVCDRWRWLGNASVIANPIVLDRPVPGGAGIRFKSSRRVLAVGRLYPVKGYDRLLDAFALVAARFPEWTLTILGEGPDRSSLEQQIADLDLAARVCVPGNVNDPFEWMAAADFLVMSSRYEGFPCVLGEALACGLPVISFDCNSGPRDIVRNGVDGILVEPDSVQALSVAMARLMTNESERLEMARRAPEVLDRFSLGSILGQWDRLLERVMT